MKWIASWKAKSSKGTREYTVSLADDCTFGCSCLAWTRRRIQCRHIKWVKRNKKSEIAMAVEDHDLPLKYDDLADDWVKVVDIDDEPEKTKCTRTDGKEKDCGAYCVGGFCDCADGPCSAKDLEEMGVEKSLADELNEELAKLDGKMPPPPKNPLNSKPTVLSLIQKNAQWRI